MTRPKRRLTQTQYRELADVIDRHMQKTGRAPSPAWLEQQIAALVARRKGTNR